MVNKKIERMKAREKYLIKEIGALRRQEKGFPKEYLQTSRHGSRVYYYECFRDEEGVLHRKFLRKNEQKRISELALKQYVSRRMAELVKELSGIQAFLSHYNHFRKPSADELLLERPEYAKFLQPVLKPMAYQAKRWAEAGEGSDYYEEAKVHTSKGGLKVRSKSEAMIASCLEERGIPFRYENRLQTMRSSTIPDFTLMSASSGKKFYWEHFGMLDDADYCMENMKKLLDYQEIGVFAGENLIITVEDSKRPLTYDAINKLLDELMERMQEDPCWIA